MQKIGFSTGAAYPFHSERSVSLTVIDALPNLGEGLSPLEICCLDLKQEFPPFHGLVRQLSQNGHLSKYPIVSIHAPVSGIRYGHNAETWSFFEEIRRIKFPVARIIFHPDTVKEWSVFRQAGFDAETEICFENTDKSKFGGTVSDMVGVLGYGKFGFVFDIAHAFSCDPTGGLANEFVLRLGNKIAEIHVSGVRDGHHAPLFETRQDEMFETLGKIERQIPIIIESPCSCREDLEREMRYVFSGLDRGLLNRRGSRLK